MLLKIADRIARNKQLDKVVEVGGGIFSVSECVWGITVSPQSGHHVRKQSVTTVLKGGQLLCTSPQTFPDFNNHIFPISLINPRVAVTQSSCTQHGPSPLASWLNTASSVLSRGSVRGRPQTEITSCFAHWHAAARGVVLGARPGLILSSVMLDPESQWQ